MIATCDITFLGNRIPALVRKAYVEHDIWLNKMEPENTDGFSDYAGRPDKIVTNWDGLEENMIAFVNFLKTHADEINLINISDIGISV